MQYMQRANPEHVSQWKATLEPPSLFKFSHSRQRSVQFCIQKDKP